MYLSEQIYFALTLTAQSCIKQIQARCSTRVHLQKTLFWTPYLANINLALFENLWIQINSILALKLLNSEQFLYSVLWFKCLHSTLRSPCDTQAMLTTYLRAHSNLACGVTMTKRRKIPGLMSYYIMYKNKTEQGKNRKKERLTLFQCNRKNVSFKAVNFNATQHFARITHCMMS